MTTLLHMLDRVAMWLDRARGRHYRDEARAAIERCWGIPYVDELSRTERMGMESLERAGEVVRDEGGMDLHWHRAGERDDDHPHV